MKIILQYKLKNKDGNVIIAMHVHEYDHIQIDYKHPYILHMSQKRGKKQRLIDVLANANRCASITSSNFVIFSSWTLILQF